ncbi:MAG TPA: molybdenum cofactor biosynthesis protein MoaE, partial [Variovorax sp.]
MSASRVSIRTGDFDLQEEIAALRAGDARVGAVCSFVGTVRDRNDGSSVASMELEHYPGMTERAIEAMIDEAHRRFHILGARVIHRVGLLAPQDQIMMVAVTAAHRG